MSVHRRTLLVATLLAGCAATPDYDPAARESLGRIVAINLAGSREQLRADSYDAAPALMGAIGIAGLVLGRVLEKRTDIPIHEFRIRTEDGREVSVLSDYLGNRLGDCVKLFESARPSYPRFISHDGCRQGFGERGTE